MSNSLYRLQSRIILESLADALEEVDASGAAEVELVDGILTIAFNSGKQLVISCHAPSQQIWLASPLSGGLHFSGVGGFTQWQLPDGRSLAEVLAAEIKQLGKLDIAF